MKYFYLLILITLTACTSGILYDGSVVWKFSVKHNNSDRIDTLSLYKADSWYPKIKWDFKFKDGGYAVEKLFTANSSVIKLPSPYGIFLNKTELVPHPEVHFPIEIGNSYESNYKTDSQDKGVDNIDVEGNLEVTGKILYKQELLKGSSWVINAEGNSSAGKFTSTYYFHEKYGFVYFKYNLGKDTVEIDLINLHIFL